MVVFLILFHKFYWLASFFFFTLLHLWLHKNYVVFLLFVGNILVAFHLHFLHTFLVLFFFLNVLIPYISTKYIWRHTDMKEFHWQRVISNNLEMIFLFLRHYIRCSSLFVGIAIFVVSSLILMLFRIVQVWSLSSAWFFNCRVAIFACLV